MERRLKQPRGFTLLELQVAIILLAMGIATLSSVVTTQSRLYRKLRGNFKPDTTLYLTQSSDAWARSLNIPARITLAPISPTTPTPISSPANTVTVLSATTNLTAESMSVSTLVTETP